LRLTFLFLLFLLALIQPKSVANSDARPENIISSGFFGFETVGYAQDRCCRPGCMASVRPGTAGMVARITSSRNAASVYFAEDSAVITTAGRARIRSFVEANPNARDVTIIGYTDGCGTGSYNHSLSMRRAQAAMREYQRLADGVRIQVRPAGEIAVGHDDEARRVDIAITTNVTVYEPPPRIIADVYLIDASGSMSSRNWELWRRAIAFHRPPGSRVYVSTTQCIYNGTSYSSIRPAGGTEIWYSYWSVLDEMRPGETLLIISDFDSDIPLTRSERSRLMARVRSKGVTVKYISLSR